MLDKKEVIIHTGNNVHIGGYDTAENAAFSSNVKEGFMVLEVPLNASESARGIKSGRIAIPIKNIEAITWHVEKQI